MADNNVSGMTGGSLPDWLADWLVSQGQVDSRQDLGLSKLSPPQNLGITTPSIFNSPEILNSISGGSGENILLGGEGGDGLDFNNSQSFNQGSIDFGKQGQAIKEAVLSNLGGITGIPVLDYVPEVIQGYNKLSEYGSKPDVYGPPTAPKTLMEGAIDFYDKASTEISDQFNSFTENPISTVGGLMGFDFNSNEEGIFSNTGEVARNIGKGFEYSRPLTGPIGMLGEIGAGVAETSALDDRLAEVGAKPLDFLDMTWAAISPTDTLRSEALENFHNALRDNNRTVADTTWAKEQEWDHPSDFMKKELSIYSPEQIQKQRQRSGLFGMGSGIDPAFQTIPEEFRSKEGYDTRINTIETIEQAHQYWNTQEEIKAAEEEFNRKSDPVTGYLANLVGDSAGKFFEWSGGEDGSTGSNESSGSDTDQGGNEGYGNDGGGQDDYD